jgi:hypothetical protein
MRFSTMFHMSNDSHLFRTRRELEEEGWNLEGNVFTGVRGPGRRYLPLYEAKMLHHYDHRWATYTNATDSRLVQPAEKQAPATVAQPRYWVPEKEVREQEKNRWSYRWLLGFRRVARSTDERSAIFSILPDSGPGDSVFLMMPQAGDATAVSCLFAGLDTFAYDFVVRQKVGGMNFNFYIAEQLPVLPPDAYDRPAPWSEGATLRDWIAPRVLELTYTAHDLAPFARDLGYEGEPFPWDPERRFLLRSELDAAYFHLYGIAREDAEYIMGTFPIVERKDVAAHGEYRTKRVILEIYDRMARAAETGKPYRTPLDPPPVYLGASDNGSATVAPPWQHAGRQGDREVGRNQEPRPEEASPAETAVEDEESHGTGTRANTDNRPPERSRALVDTIQEDDKPSQLFPGHWVDTEPPLFDEARAPAGPRVPTGSAAPEAPKPREATLALNACLPDGKKVGREGLLADAARELGHARLTKKVRRALNQVLNAEHNAGRLKTDWQRVWRPRKK